MLTEEEEEANAVATLLAGARGAAGASPPKTSPKASGANKRWRITPKALELLECVYAQEACPSTATRDVLALQLGATPRQVQVWFQNKRQRRAGKAKREMDANSDNQAPISPSPHSSPLPSVPETVSTQSLLDETTGGTDAPASTASEPQPLQPSLPSLSVFVPPSPDVPSAPAHATAPLSTDPPPALGGMASTASASTSAPPRAGRGNSLNDLASVAECVDNLEHLTGGLARVNSLKDLVALSRAGSTPMRQVDLASLSKVVSLADLASFASTLGAQQQVAT